MKKKLTRPFMVIVYGPTAVGKTTFSLALAADVSAEIINADIGQFYEPLSVGTAKPDWKSSHIPHHFFDILAHPCNYTVAQYRDTLCAKLHEIIARGNLPILVGGSGFYIHSLLFPPAMNIEDADISSLYPENSDFWAVLHSIDSIRASHIDKNDIYRIKRALSIWHTTGQLPSSFSSVYNPPVDYILIFLDRDRQQLYEQINKRVVEMIEHGWIDEALLVQKTPWEPFIRKKNIIGYSEVFDYIEGKKTDEAFSNMVERIQIRTRNYAKRQCTFWRKLEREIKSKSQYTGINIGCVEMINLTKYSIDLYISQLLQRLPLQ